MQKSFYDLQAYGREASLAQPIMRSAAKPVFSNSAPSNRGFNRRVSSERQYDRVKAAYFAKLNIRRPIAPKVNPTVDIRINGSDNSPMQAPKCLSFDNPSPSHQNYDGWLVAASKPSQQDNSQRLDANFWLEPDDDDDDVNWNIRTSSCPTSNHPSLENRKSLKAELHTPVNKSSHFKFDTDRRSSEPISIGRRSDPIAIRPPASQASQTAGNDGWGIFQSGSPPDTRWAEGPEFLRRQTSNNEILHFDTTEAEEPGTFFLDFDFDFEM